MVGLSAVRANDAWAMGEIVSDDSLVPIVEHWNGGGWHRVALPRRVTNHFDDSDLWGAFGASSADNVWAFTLNGQYLSLRGKHWTAGVVPRASEIEAAKVLSPRDVWVFGNKLIGGTTFNPRFRPYAANFNGRRWRTVPIPGRADIVAVSALSRTNIFAVTGPADSGAAASPRVLHWDGNAWRAGLVQPRLSKRAAIYTILAQSDADVWIGGSTPINSKETTDVVQHWDGASWTNVTPPGTRSGLEDLVASLAADGRGGLWGLGVDYSSRAGLTDQLWHNTGGTWSAPVTPHRSIGGVAAVPGSTLNWAVGSDKIRGHYIGVIVEHRATHCHPANQAR